MLRGILLTFALIILQQEYSERVELNKVIYVAEAAEIAEEVIIEESPKEESPKEVKIKVRYSESSIEQRIRDTFPETPNTAVAVAKGESGPSLNLTAYNPEAHRDRNGNVICYGSYGVMQIGCVHMMENPDALFDLETNLRVARQIYDESGWVKWGAYTSGGWEKHL